MVIGVRPSRLRRQHDPRRLPVRRPRCAPGCRPPAAARPASPRSCRGHRRPRPRSRRAPARMFSRATRSSMSVTSMSSRSSACASCPDASCPSAVMIASTRRCARDRSLHHLGSLLGGQVVDPQGVEVGPHRRQRGAQFVRGVGGEILCGLQGVRGGLLSGGQPAQHPGHRLGQVLGLADAAHFGHLLGALAEPLGVLGQPAQRPDRGAGQQPAKAARRSTPSPDRRPCTTESWRGSTECCRRGCRPTSARRPAASTVIVRTRYSTPFTSTVAVPSGSGGSCRPRWNTTWPVDFDRPVVSTPRRGSCNWSGYMLASTIESSRRSSCAASLFASTTEVRIVNTATTADAAAADAIATRVRSEADRRNRGTRTYGSSRNTYPIPRTVWITLGRPSRSSLRRR